MTKPCWGDSIRIVFLIRLAPPLYGGDTLCYQSCFPTTDETISDLPKEKSNFHFGSFEPEVNLKGTVWAVQDTASFNRRVGPYPALVPHPVLLSLQEVQTFGPPPPPGSDRILSCSFSSTFTYRRQNQLNLLSVSGTSFHFLFSFVSFSPTVIILLSVPVLALLWGQNLWAQAQTPTASPPCLHLQLVSSLTAQANVRLSFPPDCRNSSYTSHQWAKKKKAREKLLNNTGERRETKSCEGLEKLAQSPARQTCNRSGAI